MKNHIPNVLKGAAMGIAEVIPGVSGGTIAFITGIYERLLHVIKQFGPSLLTTFKEDGIKGVWEQIDGPFILSLMAGMVFGIVVGVFGITWLLDTYPVLVWSFFFGLIIASAIYVGRQLTHWGIKEIVLLLLGTAIAYGITIISPTEGSTSLIVVFMAGAIAISALILPGISGSFMLLLMGMYTIIIPTIKSALKTLDPASLLIVAVFGLGCLTGLMTFARLLSWTFKHYKNATLALLTGFMLGSLNKIWPWREASAWLLDADGQIIMEGDKPKKILMEVNLWPTQYGEDAFLMGALFVMLLGFVSVFAMEKMSSTKPESH